MSKVRSSDGRRVSVEAKISDADQGSSSWNAFYAGGGGDAIPNDCYRETFGAHTHSRSSESDDSYHCVGRR